MLDPAASAKKEQIQAEQDFQREVSRMMVDFVKSPDGREAVRRAAMEKITERYGQRLNTWESGQSVPVDLARYPATANTQPANPTNANTQRPMA